MSDDVTTADAAGGSAPAADVHESPGCPVAGRSEVASFPSREQLRRHCVAACRRAGFEICADLCGVDYLSHPGRALPEASPPERFEVVVNLLSLSTSARVRLRVQVPEADAAVARRFFGCTRARRTWSARPSTCSASSSRATPT